MDWDSGELRTTARQFLSSGLRSKDKESCLASWSSSVLAHRRFVRTQQMGCKRFETVIASEIPFRNLLKWTRQAGWWGHTLSTRFKMPSKFSPITGAQGWQQSNPSMLALATLLGSLEIFDEAGGMDTLRAKSLQLTGFLADLLRNSRFYIHADTSVNEQNVGFYNMDVIEEGDIREWCRRVKEKKVGKNEEYCRQIVKRLLERLDEQSSESESE